MANKAFTELPSSAGLADGALFAVTDDPGGTPASEAATAAQVAAYVQGKTADLTEATSINVSSDFLPARVGSNNRKVSPKTILQAGHGLSAQTTPQLQDEVIALDGSASWAAFRTTVEGILNAIGENETSTYPADPLVMMHDDGNSDPIAMTPADFLKGLVLALSTFSDAIVGASDLLLFYDQSAGAFRSITPDKLASGKWSVFLPAGAWIAQTTNGAAAETTELATNDVMLRSWLMDASTKEYVQADVWMPASWDFSTVQVAGVWTTATGTGGITLAIAGRAFGNDDALDAAFGTEVDLDDTRIADNDLHETPYGTLTIAGTPGASRRWVKLRAARQVSAGNDTKSGDLKFLGLMLVYGTAKRDDA